MATATTMRIQVIRPPISTLPPELEREIFKIAALSHFGTIPSLLRVARRVLEWIEPLLYRVLIIDDCPSSAAGRRVFQLKPNVLANGVQHVLLLGRRPWSMEDIYALLRLCGSRLRSLAGNSDPELLPTLSHLSQLRRWVGNLGSLFGSHFAIDLSISPFRTLTHMDIWDNISADDAVICPGLAALPCLTHLGLNHRRHNHISSHGVVVPRILAQCLHLQVLVSMQHSSAVPLLALDDPPTTDVRFVVSFVHDYWKDWQVGARGGTDFWVAVADFVARKRRGEIEASCFLLEN
ncbi:hypothetical protein K438DRAFT_240411 [Mycena galopus ATCC 62051]|nr:hypothetical protein K438DRAFT_240411 [Mycena galopus ATCC 62051]